jgi:hypothetical protein
MAAIFAEWQRTDRTYTQRIMDLKNGGGLNGTNRLLLNSTVKGDGGAADTLTGGQGLDWFFQFAGDTITDLGNGGPEQINLPFLPAQLPMLATGAMVLASDPGTGAAQHLRAPTAIAGIKLEELMVAALAQELLTSKGSKHSKFGESRLDHGLLVDERSRDLLLGLLAQEWT